MTLKRVKLKITLKAGGTLFRRGEEYTAPDIPRLVLQEARRRPDLFVCEYEQSRTPPQLFAPMPAAVEIDPPTYGIDGFINEWLRVREHPKDSDKSFYAYVHANRDRFAHFIRMDSRIRDMARRKWQKFYPDDEFIL